MQRVDEKNELLKTISQLIPSPDVYGVRRKIESFSEHDRVAQLLEASGGETFFVKSERRKCIPDQISSLDVSYTNGLFVTAELPNVKVFLFRNSFSQERLISEENETLFCRFMKQLGYEEVTIQPQNPFDRIEARLFSLPNEGRVDP